MDLIEIEIDKIAAGGSGFGHVNGKACFIPFAIPGDRVKARVKKEKKSYIEADLIEIINPSPDRISPACPVFGQCGGCSLQQIPYAVQLSLKENLFAEQLYRFGRVEKSKISSLIPATEPWNYRSRVQIKTSFSAGRIEMGFYRSGSHLIVPLPDHCAIASPVVNKVIAELQSCLSDCPEAELITQIDISSGDNDEAIAIIHLNGERQDAVIRFFSENHSSLIPSVNGLWLRHGAKQSLKKICGIDRLSYSVSAGGIYSDDPFRLSFSRGGFSQVNYQQNRNLVRLVIEMAGHDGTQSLLDVFCGNGNFSIPLSTLSRNVTGIEEYEPSIQDARYNAEVCGLNNLTFICSDAEKGVSRIIKKGRTFDTVLLDPPRAGAAGIMPLIPLLKPGKIIYVSCDPVTVARDVAILENLDYSLLRSVPVDMFPHTGHMESVSLLEKR